MRDVIILPTYNERENVKDIIPRIFDVVPEVHVLVVDDNSPDGTADEVRKLMGKYIHLSILNRRRKEGLGVAYKDAMSRVVEDEQVRFVVTMDADGSHKPEYLPVIFSHATTHDFVIGSRYAPGGGLKDWELWRRILSRFGNIYARTLTGLKVKDITAGFLAVRREILSKVDFASVSGVGYAFLMEIKYEVIKTLGAKYIEVPIVFAGRREGESKLSHHIVREGVKTPIKIFLKRLWKLVR